MRVLITGAHGQLGRDLTAAAAERPRPAEVVATADVVAHIPIATHSLNAAMAATVALYEMTRITPA